jgi:UDP-2-acetamido-3-amino-2,3-dideoxy-glucuronate N-acetyltransferase
MPDALHSDGRGHLGVFEFTDLPFKPARFFWIFETPIGVSRAGHAHRLCSQFIFSQQGLIEISVEDAHGQIRHLVLNPGEHFYLPPMHWLELKSFSEGSVLGVLASHAYDRAEYIDSKPEFLSLIGR